MVATTQPRQAKSDESELRELIARWSKAVRDEDLAGIRADHDPEILMFDVPPPFLSRGINAYMATWQTFFASSANLPVWCRSAVESYTWSPSQDQCGMLRPLGTSSADWW
jgi:hypothetical protein